jgi:hypothetical protein
LTGLDWSALQIKAKNVSCHTAVSKPVKQKVKGTMILPPLVFPAEALDMMNKTVLFELCTKLKTYLVSFKLFSLHFKSCHV